MESLGRTEQLRPHLRRGLDNGLGQDELVRRGLAASLSPPQPSGKADQSSRPAPETRFMAHLALMEGDGSDEPQTTWGGAVTDSDYRAPRTPAQ